MDTTTCPYCAETVRAEALRCRYCRSRIRSMDPRNWHRGHKERRVAGVAAALARAFAVPVSAVRTGFVLLTFFQLTGPLVYAALWLAIPKGPEESSWLEELLHSMWMSARRAGGSAAQAAAGAFVAAAEPAPPGRPSSARTASDQARGRSSHAHSNQTQATQAQPGTCPTCGSPQAGPHANNHPREEQAVDTDTSRESSAAS